MKALLILSLIALVLSSETYYPKCSSSCTTIVQGLNNINVDSSYSNREKIAALNNISGYKGTAEQNTQLLNLLKAGKLIKSKSSDSGSGSGSGSSTTTSNAMMKKLSADTSLGLSASKKSTLVSMGTVLLNDGYSPAFVAGVLGNIMDEGTVGLFESSNYVSNPSAEPQYLKYMDDKYSYRTKYSYKKITQVSLSELNKLMQKLENDNYKLGKFGLGCVQWTGDRTYTLVKLYIKYANGNDKITLEQATEAEGKMISTEFNGAYKSIYTKWKSANSNNLNSDDAAYNAGKSVCISYEVPADYTNKSVKRGNYAKQIYKVMAK